LVVRLRKLGSAGLLTVWAHKIFGPVLAHRRNMRPESGIFQPGKWPSALYRECMTGFGCGHQPLRSQRFAYSLDSANCPWLCPAHSKTKGGWE
jgi:hypothetical protein